MKYHCCHIFRGCVHDVVVTWFAVGVIQYIPRNMHTVFALLCFVVVIHWLIFPYPSGLLHWHCGNLTIAPVPAKQPWWIWINTSCEFIMNDCITTTKQSTTKPCAYFLGYTVNARRLKHRSLCMCNYFQGCTGLFNTNSALMIPITVASHERHVISSYQRVDFCSKSFSCWHQQISKLRIKSLL